MKAIKRLNSVRNIGRLAGLLYILIDIFGPLSLSYIPANSPQSATVWLVTDSMLEQLVGRIEVLGGIWILLVTWGALRTGELHWTLNYLGLAVGVVGITSAVPALAVLGIVFGVGEIVWGVWLGIAMFRNSPNATAQKLGKFFVVRFFVVRFCAVSEVLRRQAGRHLSSDV